MTAPVLLHAVVPEGAATLALAAAGPRGLLLALDSGLHDPVGWTHLPWDQGLAARPHVASPAQLPDRFASLEPIPWDEAIADARARGEAALGATLHTLLDAGAEVELHVRDHDFPASREPVDVVVHYDLGAGPEGRAIRILVDGRASLELAPIAAVGQAVVRGVAPGRRRVAFQVAAPEGQVPPPSGQAPAPPPQLLVAQPPAALADLATAGIATDTPLPLPLPLPPAPTGVSLARERALYEPDADGGLTVPVEVGASGARALNVAVYLPTDQDPAAARAAAWLLDAEAAYDPGVFREELTLPVRRATLGPAQVERLLGKDDLAWTAARVYRFSLPLGPDLRPGTARVRVVARGAPRARFRFLALEQATGEPEERADVRFDYR